MVILHNISPCQRHTDKSCNQIILYQFYTGRPASRPIQHFVQTLTPYAACQYKHRMHDAHQYLRMNILQQK